MKQLSLILSLLVLLALDIGCARVPLAVSQPTALPQPTTQPSSTLVPSAAPTAATDQSVASPVEFAWSITGAPNILSRPTAIAVDGQSNIYVVDGIHHRIQKFDTNGKSITMWGSEGKADGQFEFGVPDGHYGSVAVDAQNDVYVTDYTDRVQKFDSTGKFLTKWGSKGLGDGQFAGFTWIAVDSQGNVFVADADNYRIQKFDNTGKFLTKWGKQGNGDGEFAGGPDGPDPNGIAVDAQGNVFVADAWNHRIQKFDNTGKFLTKWGSSGSGKGHFSLADGVAVDQEGNVYVTDNEANNAQKFDNTGKFLAEWGSAGSDPDSFYYPEGIAVDKQGNIYVVNVIENVLKFRPR